MPSSAALLGCQSMGAMRSSKLDDFLNFHLRMMVQPIATAPMTEARTMITVRALLGKDWLDAPTAVAGTSDAVGVAVAVTEMVNWLRVCVAAASVSGAWVAGVLSTVLSVGVGAAEEVLGGTEEEAEEEEEGGAELDTLLLEAELDEAEHDGFQRCE